MRAYGKKLTAFGEWCTDQGMPLSYHHHMGAVVQTEAELDAFMQASGPGIPLLLDAGHLAFAGGDVLRAIDNHHDRMPLSQPGRGVLQGCIHRTLVA